MWLLQSVDKILFFTSCDTKNGKKSITWKTIWHKIICCYVCFHYKFSIFHEFWTNIRPRQVSLKVPKCLIFEFHHRVCPLYANLSILPESQSEQFSNVGWFVLTAHLTLANLVEFRKTGLELWNKIAPVRLYMSTCFPFWCGDTSENGSLRKRVKEAAII